MGGNWDPDQAERPPDRQIPYPPEGIIKQLLPMSIWEPIRVPISTLPSPGNLLSPFDVITRLYIFIFPYQVV